MKGGRWLTPYPPVPLPAGREREGHMKTLLISFRFVPHTESRLYERERQEKGEGSFVEKV
jgi:hypothetical protein